jgi:hypothetical protein
MDRHERTLHEHERAPEEALGHMYETDECHLVVTCGLRKDEKMVDDRGSRSIASDLEQIIHVFGDTGGRNDSEPARNERLYCRELFNPLSADSGLELYSFRLQDAGKRPHLEVSLLQQDSMKYRPDPSLSSWQWPMTVYA